MVVLWWRLGNPIRGNRSTDYFLVVRLGTEPASLLPTGENWMVKSSIREVGSIKEEEVFAKQ